MAEKSKKKGTLLYQTLKVVEKKVPSEFVLLANCPRYGRFYMFAFLAGLCFGKLPTYSK